MKLHISKDEAYPVYDLYDSDWGYDKIEVDETFYKEYLEVDRIYSEMQEKLEKIYKTEERIKE